MHDYHDREWGVPVHDDRLLFEFLILEGAQAGLSWATILKRREGYRKAFDNFDFNKISRYNEEKRKELMNDAGIIRNRLKIEASVINAKKFIEVKMKYLRTFKEVKKEFGSFNNYLWGFANNKPIDNKIKSFKEIKASTPLSDKLSKDLKKRGFKFVGSTIVYALMQAVGMVNDHEVSCFKHKEVKR